jgi:murein hydrolase activator
MERRQDGPARRRQRECGANWSFLDRTSANLLHDLEKRITTVRMQSERRQISAYLGAISLSAALCCFSPVATVGADELGFVATAQAKSSPAQRAAKNKAKNSDADQKNDNADQKNNDIDIEQARRLFEEHQKNLEQVKKEQESLESETRALDSERASLQTRLIEAGRTAQESDKQLTETEGRLETLTAQETEIRVALKESRTAIGQMLAVMQRMGREPPPVMVTKRSDALKMVRSAMVLSSFFPKFKVESERLATRLADLDKVLAEAREQRDRLAKEKQQSAQSREEIAALLVERRERLRGNFARLEDLKVAASRHTRAVTDLGDLLQRLDAEVAQHSNLAAYEAELKQLGPAVELKPEAKQVAFVQPGRLKPALPFDKVKGQLPLPCAGKKIKSFGTRDETGGKSEGIVFETRKDAQIVSPSDGWVIYAGQFRSYGQLLIINAGGGYHILLAGMDQIYTAVGQFVLAGEPVAIMGKSESQTADRAQSRGPALYIEFRKDARPIDPDPWWSQGVKEG